MELGKNQLHTGEARLWLNINRNTTTTVVDLDTPVVMNDDGDLTAMTRDRLID
jgi:hypothetical protein